MFREIASFRLPERNPRRSTVINRAIGLITVSDRISPGLRQSVRAVRDSGVAAILLTRLDLERARALGAELGVDDVVYDVAPLDRASPTDGGHA